MTILRLVQNLYVDTGDLNIEYNGPPRSKCLDCSLDPTPSSGCRWKSDICSDKRTVLVEEALRRRADGQSVEQRVGSDG